MQSSNLKRQHPNKKSRLVGRGGTRGKQSGRGGKGQTARAGNKRRPQLRDIIKKIPKLRGYRFKSVASDTAVVNLADIAKYFKQGSTVSPETLLSLGLVRRLGGKLPAVKILGTGDITLKLSFSGCSVSAPARAKIEKAGGSIEE